jgi:hypothetical protein
MQRHLLSAFVVLTPPVSLLLAFIIRPGNIQPWPQILLFGYLVAALLAVIVIVRRGHLHILGGWLGATLLVVGCLVLGFLVDPNLRASDIPSILGVAVVFLGSGVVVGYLALGPRLSGILKPALSGASVVAGGVASATQAETHIHGDWIAMRDRGSTVDFEVRQKRTDRLMRAALLLVGMIVWTAASLYFAYAGFRSDNVMLALIGAICVLAGLLVLVAALVTLMPALWALKERATSSFAVTPEGVVLQSSGRDRKVFSYASLTGPYYLTSEDAARPQTIVRNGVPLIYGGVGIGGIAAVGSVAAVDSAHRLGSALSNEIADKLRLVRDGSSGQVFIEYLAKPVVLARLLSDREARFLAEKIAEAMLKTTGRVEGGSTAAKVVQANPLTQG